MTTSATTDPFPAATPAVVPAPASGSRVASPAAASLAGGANGRGTPAPAPPRKKKTFDRLEAWLSRLSTRNNFWHRLFSLIWLPFAFRSGIKMKRVDGSTFTAVLPFRRFNRNWYNAMAGAALLGNSEIAGGMYVFGICGGDYTVVCKELNYRFLRPCFGPALYRITPRDDIQEHLAHGGEFNITLDLDVVQMIHKPGVPGVVEAGREKRVGRCAATFHVTPKAHHKTKAVRKSGEAPAEASESPA